MDRHSHPRAPQAAAVAAASAPRPARWRAALLLLAGVLLGHALMFALWPAAPGAGAHGDTGRPLQVRQITLPLPDGPAATAAAAARHAPAPAQRVARPAADSRAEGAAQPSAQPEPAAAAPPAVPSVVQSSEPAAEPGGAAAPVYATRLPPSATLHYALRRSGVPGHAELQWINDGLQYRLKLRNDAGGAQNLGSASSGAIDAHGLAPERHTDSRRGRDVRAVNFQRDSARVTFSGPRGEVPLVDGAQDRLSWMLQLAGIAEANPALREPGSEMAVFVVGTRGDAEVWLCSVVGHETIELPAGPVAAALHLRREPKRLYDTTVDIWLDPARHHLPVQARMQVRPTGQETVLLLESVSAP
jgi:hypothetical protein